MQILTNITSFLMHSEIIPNIKINSCTNEDLTLKIHTWNNYHHHHSIMCFKPTEMQSYVQKENQHQTSNWPLHYSSCRGKNLLLAGKHLRA